MEAVLNIVMVWFIASVPISLIAGKYLASNPPAELIAVEVPVKMADAS